MANTTIPKQHYVTIQYREDAATAEGLLGFASPYTKDAAFEKRKRTQDQWAYGYGVDVKIDENDDITVTGSGQQGGYGYRKVDAGTLFMSKCYPIIVNNELLEGFQIAKSVRHGGSWGSGNVVWRIADPRGFELEISSSNFAAMLGCTTMINGVIQGKCLWGRNGKDNILLPETSDVYQEAASHTTKIAKKVSLKDVKIGDTVEVLSNKVKKEDSICQFLGKYFFLEVEEGTSDDLGYQYHNGLYNFAQEQTERYLFKSKADGSYFVLSNPKLIDIVCQVETPLDRNEIAKNVTGELGRDVGISDTHFLVLISPTKINLSTVKTDLVPLSETLTNEWPKIDGYYMDKILCEHDGKYWLPTRNHHNTTGVTFKEVDLSELGQNRIRTKSHSTTSGSGYYSRTYREDVTKVIDVSDIKPYRVTVTANGIIGKVYNMGW